MSDDIKIVRMKESEYPKVADLIRRCIKGSWGDIYSDKLLKEFYKKYRLPSLKKDSKNIKYLVARDKDSVVGILGLEKNVLENFFVSPEYQGKGIGKKLYFATEDIAKKKKLDKIVLESSPKAIDFYKRLGFEEIKKVHKYRAGEQYTNLVMMKRIANK